MKVIDFGKGFSGMMDGIVYYEMNGKLYARRAPRQRTDKEKAEASAEVKGIHRRFKAIQQLYTFYRRLISPDIWRLAAKAEGKMVAPENFHFSAGVLQLPRRLAVEPLGGGRYRATWEDEREMATAAATDRLRAGVLYDRNTLALHTATEVSGARGAGRGEFALDPSRYDPGAHVYLYFAREDGSAYSPSVHFHV